MNDKNNPNFKLLRLMDELYDIEIFLKGGNRKCMWVSRDSEDNRLWLHPNSKPVLHTYTDYQGVEHKRWVTETQLEMDSELYKEVTFENSPKPLVIG